MLGSPGVQASLVFMAKQPTRRGKDAEYWGVHAVWSLDERDSPQMKSRFACAWTRRLGESCQPVSPAAHADNYRAELEADKQQGWASEAPLQAAQKEWCWSGSPALRLWW